MECLLLLLLDIFFQKAIFKGFSLFVVSENHLEEILEKEKKKSSW